MTIVKVCFQQLIYYVKNSPNLNKPQEINEYDKLTIRRVLTSDGRVDFAFLNGFSFDCKAGIGRKAEENE